MCVYVCMGTCTSEEYVPASVCVCVCASMCVNICQKHILVILVATQVVIPVTLVTQFVQIYRSKVLKNLRVSKEDAHFSSHLGVIKHYYTYVRTLSQNQMAEGKKRSISPRLCRSVVTLSGLLEK